VGQVGTRYRAAALQGRTADADLSSVRSLAVLRRARGLAVLGAAGLALAVAPPAHADSTGDAKAKARALLAQVQRLQAQVKQAEQQYDAALAGVAATVNASIESDRTSGEIAAAAAAARDRLDDRVRGLYMSGGPLALYATLLNSGNITAFQDQASVVGRIVSVDQGDVQTANRVSREADAQAATAQLRARRRIATERSVAVVATRVLTLLSQEQALLDQANARVTQVEALDAARAALAAQAGAFGTITAAGIAALRPLTPSPAYSALYHSAASTCPGLSWTVLAAIGQVESGHGRDTSTSYAGAMGPMQFEPSTFATYAVDGNHDGIRDIQDPADAIYTAAAYLCANGAGSGPDGLARAIWHYNHADWYVQMVLALAKKYAG
jgi:hypothetical protein